MEGPATGADTHADGHTGATGAISGPGRQPLPSRAEDPPMTTTRDALTSGATPSPRPCPDPVAHCGGTPVSTSGGDPGGHRGGVCRSRTPGPVDPDRGASLVEYALLIALIAVAAVAGITFFGAATGGSLDSSASSIASVMG